MKIILTLLLFAFSTNSFAQLKPIADKSEINFTIKNFGLNTNGSFSGLKGTIQFDSTKLSSTSFNISVAANTVNTGVDARDSHLKKEEYFDADKYPTISFKSTEIKKTSNGFVVSGSLTIKSTTKNISFPFSVKPQSGGLLFTGNFTINRKDYDVGGSSAVLGNNVDLSLKVFAQ